MAGLLLSAILACASAYTVDELALLNSIGGFGDVGRLDTSRRVVAPGSYLGFSLRVEWEDRARPPNWWSIRVGLPDSAQGCDEFQIYLYVDSADDEATLRIFLCETDDDRWVCWRGRLASLAPRRWHLISVKKGEMQPWLLGNRKLQWERLAALAIEPSKGRAVFYVDSPILSGPGGRVLRIFSTADDGFKPRPQWRLHPIKPQGGRCWFPYDCGRLGREDLLATPAKLAGLVGPVGVPISGYTRQVVDIARRLRASGVEVVHYSALAAGYSRFLTRRGAWAVRYDGASGNVMPLAHIPAPSVHAVCHAHPALLEAVRDKIRAIARAGIGAWMVVDYVMPYWGGMWGYHPAMIAACRRALEGADEGTVLRDGKRLRRWRFPDYFRAYNGYYPRAEDLGLKSWSEFQPPRPDRVRSEAERRRLQMFLWLRTYFWLKLADEAGRYFKSLGGDGLWIVPNPEDSYGSPDYVALARLDGVGNIFPEWFGPIGWACEACYASLPYLRSQARRGGTRLSIIQETGVGGHSMPYLDWRIAFAGVWCLTACGGLEDFDDDFIDHVPFQQMADPRANRAEFIRFRDAVAKALAFKLARQQRPRRPRAKILCIASRPPVFRGGSFFFGLGAPYSLAVGLSRARVPLDLRDSFDLRAEDLERYDVIAYCPRAPRTGDLRLLRRWLEGGQNRLLITHSFVPTRDASEMWRLKVSAELGKAGRPDILGLGRIVETDARQCTITAVSPPLSGALRPGEKLSFPSPLTRLEGASAEVLVRTDRGPLVSMARCGRGSVVYLHYPAGANTKVHQLDTRILAAVCKARGIKPMCRADFSVMTQLFKLDGGIAVVAWSGPALARWPWRYSPDVPCLNLKAPGVDERITVPWAGGSATVVDALSGQVREVGHARSIQLRLRDRVCGMWFIAEQSPAGRGLAEQVRRVLDKMRRLGFWSVPMR